MHTDLIRRVPRPHSRAVCRGVVQLVACWFPAGDVHCIQQETWAWCKSQPRTEARGVDTQPLPFAAWLYRVQIRLTDAVRDSPRPWCAPLCVMRTLRWLKGKPLQVVACRGFGLCNCGW